MRPSITAALLALYATTSLAFPSPARFDVSATPTPYPSSILTTQTCLDPSSCLRCLSNPFLTCSHDDFNQPQIIPKRALPFVLGARIGAALGKIFLFDKRDGPIVEIAKREDESPVEKRQGFVLGLRVGAALRKIFLLGDDEKMKRDALPLVDVDVGDLSKLVEKLPVVGTLDELLAKVPAIGDVPVVSDLLVDEKVKREALVDVDVDVDLKDVLSKLPVIGTLNELLAKIPAVGDLPVVSDLLTGEEKTKRSVVDDLRDFLNGIGADPTDDSVVCAFGESAC